MHRTLLAALLVVVPSFAFALDYDDLTGRYTDAPFSKAETAGISVLTEVGAVSGNPDGTFAPARTLNRAEFLKIALLLAGMQTNTVSEGCFPDVPASAWFAAYVCTAKNLGVVEGNPDGLFHPERPVNYAEALKILAELYDYDLPEPAPNERWAWYTGYFKAAEQHGVALPGSVDVAHELTRGQMARLAAAFVAEDKGELDAYRAFEKGQTVSTSSSSQSSSVSSSSSSSSSSQVSSSSSSPSSSSAAFSMFPAVSRLLVADTTSPVIYDGVVEPTEDVTLVSVELELFREIHSFETLTLIDEKQREIAVLSLQSYNNTGKTKWRADVSTGAYMFTGNTPIRVGVIAHLKSVGEGAVSNESVEIKTMQLFTVGTQSHVSQQLSPSDYHRPTNQTAFGRMTGVVSALGASVSVQQGSQTEIGRFTLTSEATVAVNNLAFIIERADLTVANIRMGTAVEAQQEGCSSEQIGGQIFVRCPVPASLRQMNGASLTLSVFADTSVSSAAQTGTVRLISPGTGTLGDAGIVSWTDGSTTFNWMEARYAADSGPVVTVTKN